MNSNQEATPKPHTSGRMSMMMHAVLVPLFWASTGHSFPQPFSPKPNARIAHCPWALNARPTRPGPLSGDEGEDLGHPERRRFSDSTANSNSNSRPQPGPPDSAMPMEFIRPRARRRNREEEEDDDLYDNQEDYYRDENDEEEEVFLPDDDEDDGGNFWSNPPARYDPVRSPKPRARLPRPDDPPRARRRPRPSQDNDGEIRRRKSTFRSGTPPPPPVIGDFYNQLFWYGIDPEESRSPADKTMFGGTKGKFNGLSYLFDDLQPANKSPPPRRRRRDGYYEEEDDYDDDDYLDDDPILRRDDAGTGRGPAYDTTRSVTPPNDAPFPRMEDNLRPEFRRPPPPPRRRAPPKLWQGGDVSNGSSQSKGDWAAQKVASWFQDERGDDYVGLRPDQDEDSNEEMERRKRRPRQSSNSWPPKVDIFSSFFGVDRERERQADRYDRQMGIGDKGGVGGRNGRKAGQERRKGYAYRYDADGSDDGAVFDADIVIMDVDESLLADESTNDETQINRESTNGNDTQSLDANGVQQKKAQSAQQPEEQKQSEQRSWEERQLARERIPPPHVQAWGPNGDLGMDARMKAYTDAMQEVRDAEYRLEQRRKKENLAIDQVNIVKVDIGLTMRRRVRNQREERQMRDEVRNLERDLDDANTIRRRATMRVQHAQRRLSELNDWYGPLLSLYSPSQAEDGVNDALREFQEDEPAARKQNRPSESSDGSSTSQRPSPT